MGICGCGRDSRKGLRFFDESEYVAIEGTIHIKGFGRGIVWDAVTESLRQTFLQRVVKLAPKRIAFDGDDYRTDSFTSLIQEILNQKGLEKIDVVAFLCHRRREEFAHSWSSGCQMNLPIDVYLCPNMSYGELGVFALTKTGASVALCFGGGGVLADEVERLRAPRTDDTPPSVLYMVFPVARFVSSDSGSSQKREESRLVRIECEAVSVVGCSGK